MILPVPHLMSSHLISSCAGLSEYRVQTAADVLRILSLGTANRHTRSTNFNDTSSRSHALLQLHFEIESKQTDGQTLLYRSKLSLVDLVRRPLN